MLNRLQREHYFLSSHMLYLTSQSNKLSDVWCFESFNKDYHPITSQIN